MLFYFLHLQECANGDGRLKIKDECSIWQIFIVDTEILAEKKSFGYE